MLFNSHRLINKLMSRSYFDYIKTNEKPTKPVPRMGEEFKIQLPNEEQDLSSLNELTKNLLPL